VAFGDETALRRDCFGTVPFVKAHGVWRKMQKNIPPMRMGGSLADHEDLWSRHAFHGAAAFP
jgi:hypothetical protein